MAIGAFDMKLKRIPSRRQLRSIEHRQISTHGTDDGSLVTLAKLSAPYGQGAMGLEVVHLIEHLADLKIRIAGF